MYKKATTIIFLLATIVVVLLVYIPSLNFSWKFFDEEMIYDETLLPIPKSITELTEIIRLFGLNNLQEAANPFYSNISNYRGTPLTTLVTLIVFYLFKGNAFNYHLFMLILHLINTSLCFFILLKISNLGETQLVASLQGNILRITLISVLTLIWALHPANVESVLFATNFGALITYMFCFLFVFFFVNGDAINRVSTMHYFLLFLIYLFPLFFNEYSITLPFILFSYLFASYLFSTKNTSLFSAFSLTLKNTSPFFLAFFIYIIYHLFSPVLRTSSESSISVTLERIFWFSPQIFFHLLKILFFPVALTIDQSANVKLASSLFEPYPVFCSLLMFSLLFISVISIPLLKRKPFFLFFILFFPFFFALLPFLHIASPIYNLASERYLYLPTFFFVFGLAHIIFLKSANRDAINRVSTVIILFCILISFGSRTYVRTFDWKNSETLLLSSVKATQNKLFKALRKHMTARGLLSLEKANKEEVFKKHTLVAIKYAKEAILKFKSKKIMYQNKVPLVLKFYGLDPKTQEVKSAFLLGIIALDNTGDPYNALEIVKPYVNKLKPLDTQLLSFYYKVLFNTKNYDEAERLLQETLKKNRISATLLVALSDFMEFKYKNYKETEKYLLLSFKYFPYESNTLFGLRRFYGSIIKNNERFAYFSYLFGLRTHSKTSLKESALVYLALNKKQEAKKVLRNLLKNYEADKEILELKIVYENKFGETLKV